MEALFQWGIDLIVAIQRIHSPALDSLFRLITSIGAEEFYLLLLPLVFWCVDFRLGARLAVLFLLSSYMNAGLKDLLQMPRPFDLNPNLRLVDADGYGLPSGHSQSALVVWGGIATWMRKSWFWILAVGLILSIGFSRVYLGVHFPADVLVGWIIGIVLVALFVTAYSRIERWLTKFGLCTHIILALAIPLALLVLHPTEQTTAALAALAGVGVGLSLTHRYVSFSAWGPWWQRACRLLTGGAVIISLYVGLKMLLPGEESTFYPGFLFIRYFSIGLWGSFGGPWLFRSLRLAPAEKMNGYPG